MSIPKSFHDVVTVASRKIPVAPGKFRDLPESIRTMIRKNHMRAGNSEDFEIEILTFERYGERTRISTRSKR